MNFANTPKPPYYAVIFTSIKNDDVDGYEVISKKMLESVKNQPGFLGVEDAREGLGITVSYWEDVNAILNWKNNTDHLDAQKEGKDSFYKAFKVRICKVERDYELV